MNGEVPKEDPKNQNVSRKEFEQYLSQQIPNYKCPCCNKLSVSMITQADNTTMAQLHLPANPLGYVPSVGFVCAECGFINLFFWKKIFDWVLDKRKLAPDVI
jgi:hypothetical protein